MIYDFIHMWNLRNKANEHGVGRERKTIKHTLNYREQTAGYQRGGESGVGEIGDGDLEGHL